MNILKNMDITNNDFVTIPLEDKKVANILIGRAKSSGIDFYCLDDNIYDLFINNVKISYSKLTLHEHWGQYHFEIISPKLKDFYLQNVDIELRYI